MSKANRSYILWVQPDVCGLFSGSVGSFSANVGLSALIFSDNVGTKMRCSRAERFTLSGRYIYQALATHGGGSPPSAIDLEQPLAAALRVDNVFKAICASKGHANTSLHAVFALAMARYILDFEWQDVTSP